MRTESRAEGWVGRDTTHPKEVVDYLVFTGFSSQENVTWSECLVAGSVLDTAGNKKYKVYPRKDNWQCCPHCLINPMIPFENTHIRHPK